MLSHMMLRRHIEAAQAPWWGSAAVIWTAIRFGHVSADRHQDGTPKRSPGPHMGSGFVEPRRLDAWVLDRRSLSGRLESARVTSSERMSRSSIDTRPRADIAQR
jgi:hypothetical protein